MSDRETHARDSPATSMASASEHPDDLETLWFEHLDPYDLDEVDRQDRDAPALVSRSSVRFEIADFIKLDSAALTELLGPSQKVTSTKPSAPGQPTVPVGRPDDYDIEDCFK
ncbi:hypothetical protein FB45DRAFT_1004816 [Roridomyces roridus]|uniref:Uncharacterized protein n=1 Tax=Roridomyces roridus TaxID=1738132 RepID=A0AAD7BQ60_9AGAR|nr:hypothetical protein FB45DRAFT_1004816 [Roridomyces roridus]